MNETYLWFLGGTLLGAVLYGLWSRARVKVLEEQLRSARAALDEKTRVEAENERLNVELAELRKELEASRDRTAWLEKAEQHLREAFQALAGEVLKNNAEAFIQQARTQLENLHQLLKGDWKTQKAEMQNLVQPLQKTLETLDLQVRELERKREGAYRELREQLRTLGETQLRLQDATSNLVHALRSPTARGRWGEFQLRRVVEMAGLVRHVSFTEQVATDGGRPDMLIYLPNGGILPVDAKTPLNAFLDAMEADDEGQRRDKLRQHAQAMRQRVRDLSQKSYWDQFKEAPPFVVMFVPNEASINAAFEQDPEILEYAIQQRVLITSPVTLLALLKAVAYGWQQQKIAESARQIADLGRVLYQRLQTFMRHMHKAGKQLDEAVRAYNSAVGSLEGRVLPAARRFRDLGAVSEDLPAPRHVTRQARLPTVNRDDGEEEEERG